MTKEEVIEKAYGIHWEPLRDFVDKDGWVEDIRCGEKHSLPIGCEWKASRFCRPLELTGIEHNNGWIKIESEADLPKVMGYYDFQKFPQEEYIINPVFRHPNSTKIGWVIENYTHYQPIVKPTPPIY